MRRALWYVLVPAVACAAITAVVTAFYLPTRYQSETLILVVPPRVPESYVRSTVTTRIEDRLQSIAQQILSRTRLERIILDYELYADDRRYGIMEDVVEGMRRDVSIQVVKGDAFSIAYEGDDPSTVMRVTERLASLFIEESLRDREVLAEGTNQFLESQLNDSRDRLITLEKTLEDYRRRYNGQLPSQLDSNLQALQSTQLQMQSIVQSINRDSDRRTILERQLADLESFEKPVTAAEGPDAGPAQQDLSRARANLAALRLRLTPEHPDIQLAMRQLGSLEALADREAAGARQHRLSELRLELDLVKRQLETAHADERRLRSVVLSYQARVAAAPTRDTELAELTRDYDTLRALYSSLLEKKEESKIAANLERQQIGEQFKVLDPARVPEQALAPSRGAVNMAGAGVGLGLGFVGVLARRKRLFARPVTPPSDNTDDAGGIHLGRIDSGTEGLEGSQEFEKP